MNLHCKVKKFVWFYLLLVITIFMIPLIVETTAQTQEELNKSLLVAAENGNFEKVKEYLYDGADIDAKSNEGYTALIFASARGY